MAPARDFEGVALLDGGPHPSRLGGELGQCRGQVERREGRRCGCDLGAARHDLADEILPEAQLECQGALCPTGDFAFEPREISCRIALRSGHRLTMDELGPELWGVV